MIVSGKKTTSPQTIEDLYDGAVFSELLEILDDQYDASELRQNLSLADATGQPTGGRRRNLHIIHLALRSFVRRQCEDVEALIKEINFQVLDKEPSHEGMCEILAAFLVASVNLSSNQLSQNVLQDMNKTAASKQTLGQLLQVMQESNNRIEAARSAETEDHDASISSMGGAAASEPQGDLALEAEVARLHRDNEQLLKQNADYKTLHDRLRDNHDELKLRFEELESEKNELERQVESGMQGAEALAAKKREIKENSLLIDNLEAQLRDEQARREQAERAEHRATKENEELRPLKDEVHELRAINTELDKKVNAIEHLKQKLQTLSGVESENVTLRQERNAIYELHAQIEKQQSYIDKLKDENSGYGNRMEQYELQEAEFREYKMVWQAENMHMKAELDKMKDRRRQDEEVMKDLQERAMLGDQPGSPATPMTSRLRNVSLEDELRDDDENLSIKDIEISRLKAEIALLKSSVGTDGDKGQLLEQVEKERDARKALQEKYNNLFEKHTVSQVSLNAMIEGNDAYTSLQNQMTAEETRAKDLESKLEDAEAEIKDKERALVEAQGDCKMLTLFAWGFTPDAAHADQILVNALAKEGDNVLSELKATDGMLAISLRTELDALRQKYDRLKGDYDSKQEQLISSLIDKEQMRRELETAQKAAEGMGANPAELAKTTEKMEKLRIKYKQLHEVSWSSWSLDAGGRFVADICGSNSNSKSRNRLDTSWKRLSKSSELACPRRHKIKSSRTFDEKMTSFQLLGTTLRVVCRAI
jgi:protein HOOK3